MGLKEILKAHLIDPVIQLQKDFPNSFFTEKGYDILLDNAVEEIEKEYKRRSK